MRVAIFSEQSLQTNKDVLVGVFGHEGEWKSI